MPLSEDEQRILDQIESQLYESDPSLARDIADTTIYSVARRRLVVAVVGFVAGLALLLVMLQTNFVLSFAGFAVMLLAAMSIEANLRRMGKAGMDQLSRSMSNSGLRDYLGNARNRMGEPQADERDDD